MSWDAAIAGLMAQEKAAGIKLAVMTGADSCKIGDLKLTAEDLYFADHLLQAKCTKVSETAPDGGGTCTDNSTYLSALSAGDIVAVVQISDTRFLVLERMVSG